MAAGEGCFYGLNLRPIVVGATKRTIAVEVDGDTHLELNPVDTGFCTVSIEVPEGSQTTIYIVEWDASDNLVTSVTIGPFIPPYAVPSLIQ